MRTQVYNPMPATYFGPTFDYVAADDPFAFVSEFLRACWISHTPDDPNGDCSFPRPWDRDDVAELRGIFLDLFEDVADAVQRGDLDPDYDGWLDTGDPRLVVHADGDESGHDDVIINLGVLVRDDAIAFEIGITGSDPMTYWITWDAIRNHNACVMAARDGRRAIA